MWLEIKYINMLAGTLQGLVAKGNNVWNFKCPLCGDSEKTKSKKRGYLLESSGTIASYCHNCHAALSFSKFLQQVNPHLYDQYASEKFLASTSDIRRNNRKKPEVVSATYNVLLKLPRLSLLDPAHPAVEYVKARQIPRKWHSRLYVASHFNKFANEFVPDRYNVEHEEQRLIIPMLDQHKNLIGFQGRSLKNGKKVVRYITVMLSPDNPRFFGLDAVDFNRKNYILEGPFDSMFLPNAIATCGGLLHREAIKSNIPTERSVVVYDNEPRNPHIVQNMRRAVSAGFAVCVWPDKIVKYGTDVNDIVIKMVEEGSTVADANLYIQQAIDDNTFKGMEADLMITQWSKI